MIELGNQLSTKGLGLVQNLALVAVAAVLLVVYGKTRSFASLLGAGICGAIMLFGVYNPEWFKDKVGKDLDEAPTAPAAAGPLVHNLDLSDLGVRAA